MNQPEDRHALPEPLAQRVLTRASELDAALAAGSTVAELRAAAREAGISEQAFEAALREVREAQRRELERVREAPPPAMHSESGEGTRRTAVPAVPLPVRPRTVRRMMAGAVGLIVAGILTLRLGGPSTATTAGPPMVDDALVLNCLSPTEGATLIRPLLTLPENRVLVTDAAPRVLSVHATPQQLQQVRDKLAEYEQPGSPSCTARANPPVAR